MRRIDGIYQRTGDWAARPTVTISRSKIFWSLFCVWLAVSSLIVLVRPVGATVDVLQLIHDGRYLIAFQNNTELRPSGGFLGSFAIVDIKDKKLESYWFETNIYKADHQFSKNYFIPPPKPLAESWPGNSWAFNSSNWAVDFYEAASAMKWFYENEYQDKIDGIMAINASVMVKLLEIIGPLPLPEYQLTVTADNFLEEIQYKVEREYFESAENLFINEPKTILKDLMVAILGHIKDGVNPIDMWQFFETSLEKKDIQMAFFNNTRQQSIVEKRNWGGRLWNIELPGHYLLINNANLNGGKGSLGVKQTVRYEIRPGDNNQFIELTITRTNEGRDDGWEVGENRNYTRVLVPLGSKFIEARFEGEPIEGVSIEIESGKTSFGFWFTTPLYQSRTVKLRYKLPFLENRQSNQLIYQKQSGSPPDLVELYDHNQPIYSVEVDRDMIIDSLARPR